jgi:hypothetical protein
MMEEMKITNDLNKVDIQSTKIIKEKGIEVKNITSISKKNGIE